MTKERIKTGIQGLDEMLEGGLIPGRPYCISGTSGSGKTTLAMHFLVEGARNGEEVLYVALDEPPNEVRRNMESVGLDLKGVLVFDATPDVMNYEKTPVRDVSTERKLERLRDVADIIRKSPERNPADISIHTLQETLKQTIRTGKYTRVAIDSLTSLRYFYVTTSEEDAALQSFLRILSDLKVTSLLTVHLPEIPSPCTETYVARGEVRLHKWFDGRGLVRGLTIEKFRGSSHDHRLRTVKISSSGLVVTAHHHYQRRMHDKGESVRSEEDQPTEESNPGERSDGLAQSGNSGATRADQPSQGEVTRSHNPTSSDHGGDGI